MSEVQRNVRAWGTRGLALRAFGAIGLILGCNALANLMTMYEEPNALYTLGKLISLTGLVWFMTHQLHNQNTLERTRFSLLYLISGFAIILLGNLITHVNDVRNENSRKHIEKIKDLTAFTIKIDSKIKRVSEQINQIRDEIYCQDFHETIEKDITLISYTSSDHFSLDDPSIQVLLNTHKLYAKAHNLSHRFINEWGDEGLKQWLDEPRSQLEEWSIWLPVSVGITNFNIEPSSTIDLLRRGQNTSVIIPAPSLTRIRDSQGFIPHLVRKDPQLQRIFQQGLYRENEWALMLDTLITPIRVRDQYCGKAIGINVIKSWSCSNEEEKEDRWHPGDWITTFKVCEPGRGAVLSFLAVLAEGLATNLFDQEEQ